MNSQYKITKTNPAGTKTRWAVRRISNTNQPIGKAEIFDTEAAAKRFVDSKKTGVKESYMSSILKGILSESSERVSVVYVDGKAGTKYNNNSEAKDAVMSMKKKYPNKKYEIKQETKVSTATTDNSITDESSIIKGLTK